MRYSVALALFAGATVLWLLPVVSHLGGNVLGAPHDATSTIRDYWAIAAQGGNPFTIRHDYLAAAPEGFARSPTITVANAAQPLFIWSLKDLVGLVAAWNLWIILGFVLSGLSMFILLDQLGLHFLAAIFGGYAYAFSTYQFEEAFLGHAGLIQVWIFPLLLLALLRLQRTRTLPGAILVGLALATAFYLNSYFALFAIFLVIVFMAVDFALAPGWPARLWSFTLLDVTFATTAVLFSPALVMWLRNRSDVSVFVSHPSQALQVGGAHVLDYFTPSSWHPVFGGGAHGLAGFVPVEHALFLGYAPMALALTAVVLLASRRVLLPSRSSQSFLVTFSLVLVPASFLMSLPRFVHPFGLTLPMPAYFIGEVTTSWRLYLRFGLFVGLGSIVLAAVALDVLVRRRHGLLLGVALLALAVFELAPGPPIETWAANRSPAYATWLARHPGGIVANYPLVGVRRGFAVYFGRYYYEQVFHGHPLFDLPVPDVVTRREEAIRLLARDPSDPETAGILAAEHVRYVVLHEDVYRSQGQQVPDPPSGSFRQVAVLPSARIYELVHAEPADLHQLVANSLSLIPRIEGISAPRGTYGPSGFHQAEQYQDGRLWRWMEQDGTIEVDNESSAKLFQFVALAFSAHRVRKVELLDERDRVLATADVGTASTQLTLGPFHLPPGRSSLRLHTDPGPEELGGGDTRIASIFISPFAIQPLVDLSVSAEP